MNKKVIVFLLVLIGLGGLVWWKTSAPQSAQDRLAQAMRIMEGLQSQAIPTSLTSDQLTLLEQVYQDSLERVPNIQAFRTTDKASLIDVLKTSNFAGTGANGLNTAGEKIVSTSLGRTDDFNAYLASGFTSDVGTASTKDKIKKLAQSVNTLTNDIRLTTLYISWYEGVRGKICTTNDPENDIYMSGEVKMVYNPNTSLQDTCDNNSVKQYKCINGLYENDAAHVSQTQCANGCSVGVCLKNAVASDLSITMPETAVVGQPVQVRVTAPTNYAQRFFVIVSGDDNAVFPAGALSIMSGEVSANNTVSRDLTLKFSQAGTMTVIIRPTTGAEVSKTIVVVNSSTGGGATVSCSSITGVSTNSCNRCVRFNLPNSASAMNVFVPRTGIPAGNKEIVLTGQSTITAERYQGTQVSPTGNINNSFLLTESSPTNNSWIWATMNSASFITKGPISESINRNAPIYGIRFQIASVLKNAANSVVPGTDTTTTECYFYYEQPAVAPVCGNGIKEGNEECDDGNTSNSDSCSTICKNNLLKSCDATKDYTLETSTTICRGKIKGHGVEAGNGCQNIVWEPIEWVTKNCTPVTSVPPQCTGTRPANSIINANVGSTSRAWTYDGSQTGPYQNCTFRCQTGSLYQGGTCTDIQISQPACPAVLTPVCTNGTLIDNGADANGCPKAKTCSLTSNAITIVTPVCPLYTTPACTDGTLVDGGKDANGCAKALTCVKNTVTCPTYTAPASTFCTGGQIIDGGLDANGCQKPATCGPKLITGNVTVDGVKDCWFGDTTKKITLGDFIGYQASSSSGLKYLDEVLLYGATAPTTTPSLTNIFSYEESLWTAADGSTPTNATSLSNFFILRTNSEGTRTWNIPTTGTKFYGCFARGDRPNTW